MATLKLTDTQRVIIAAAGARDSGLVLPLPKSLRINRGTQSIVLRGLLSKGLITERPAQSGEEFWESGEDGSRTALVITDAGLAAVGIVPDQDANTGEVLPSPRKPKAKIGAASNGRPKNPRRAAIVSVSAAPRAESGKDTKLGILIAVLRRKKRAHYRANRSDQLS